MTTTIPTSKSACSVTTRPGNAAVDYGGAQIRAYLHHLATVVTIRGEIDAANVEQISEHVRRFSLGTNPMVLDPERVESLQWGRHLALVHPR